MPGSRDRFLNTDFRSQNSDFRFQYQITSTNPPQEQAPNHPPAPDKSGFGGQTNHQAPKICTALEFVILLWKREVCNLELIKTVLKIAVSILI
jgi:hypothetical protein